MKKRKIALPWFFLSVFFHSVKWMNKYQISTRTEYKYERDTLIARNKNFIMEPTILYAHAVPCSSVCTPLFEILSIAIFNPSHCMDNFYIWMAPGKISNNQIPKFQKVFFFFCQMQQLGEELWSIPVFPLYSFVSCSALQDFTKYPVDHINIIIIIIIK